ncbi:MAG: outer membrane protein assembly factor BamA [Gammaproteobacteria bacterium]|nr:outer membrane protein assembly factor BamA [Gammaproteobacteria bacterium]
MRIPARISAVILLMLAGLLLPGWAQADSFVVEDIEIVGIKKITPGTVFSYLPINIGETLDVERTPEIIRELYSTGFFYNIELLRRDNVLVIKVEERPSIAEVNFEGNNDIEDEALQEAMDGVGMSKGRIFDENKLEKLELELQQVYNSMGKYAARIESKWYELDEGRIAIDINISEGLSAKIESINVTGNQDFDDAELIDLFQLEPSDAGWFADDDYSSSKLAADMETLKSFYEDRGYIQFEVNSQQVTIDPDRRDISISINIREGEQFSISKVDVGGDMVVPASELQALIHFREGEIFSRKEVNKAISAMQKRLGEEGYAFAEIRVLSDIDEDASTVTLRFLVVPGNKMRVRYIKFTGNEKTKDNVLRREMRQFEGAVYQTSKIDRSRVRLQRLNYLGSVDISPQKVPDSVDEVDLVVAVTERFSGNLSVGIGYSRVQNVVLTLGFAHENLFGTGNAMELTFNNSKASQQYSVRYKNPYYTPDGVSRGFDFVFTETDASENNTSNFLIDRISMSVDYGIPLSEYNALNLEVGALRNDLSTTSGSADEVFGFIVENSDEYNESTPESEIEGDVYDTLFTRVGLSKDTRNRRIFADSGSLNGISLEVNGGDLYYYKSRYRHQSAFGLSDLFTLSFKGRLGYGGGFNETSGLPIYEKYTAGGVRSIRGYEYNSLGPLDSNGDPLGGDFQVITTTEILFPIDALASSETFRVGVYFDAGNVFADIDDFEVNELRQSVGLSAKWFSVIGPIEFSYAWPLNDEPGDDIQNFQFALGATF